jgi:hypothetical protein
MRLGQGELLQRRYECAGQLRQGKQLGLVSSVTEPTVDYRRLSTYTNTREGCDEKCQPLADYNKGL